MVKGKKKVASRWWGDWTLLWIFGGFILAYFIYIPVTGDSVHPEHWLFSILVGGAAGYGLGFFNDIVLPQILRFVRRIRKQRALRPGREKRAKRRK